MAAKVNRRSFITGVAATAGAVACGGLVAMPSRAVEIIGIDGGGLDDRLRCLRLVANWPCMHLYPGEYVFRSFACSMPEPGSVQFHINTTGEAGAGYYEVPTWLKQRTVLEYMDRDDGSAELVDQYLELTIEGHPMTLPFIGRTKEALG